jgi:uncharacterized protein YecE (DUF72 family)
LRDHGAALCLADTDEEPLGDLAVTAGWGYLRLRRASYTEDDLVRWSERVRAQPWDRAYVFFKHGDERGARISRRASWPAPAGRRRRALERRAHAVPVTRHRHSQHR